LYFLFELEKNVDGSTVNFLRLFVKFVELKVFIDYYEALVLILEKLFVHFVWVRFKFILIEFIIRAKYIIKLTYIVRIKTLRTWTTSFLIIKCITINIINTCSTFNLL
jgi:hypothetical protein